MSNTNLLNATGLVFDIAGAILIWLFGLSAIFADDGEVLTVVQQWKRS